MADLRPFGSTSNLIRFILTNSSTGQGLTGLTGSSSGLIISTICDIEATATAYTAAGSSIQTIATLGTFSAPSANDCRFAQVDSTNHPGLYEFQFADARFSISNAKRMVITVSGAASLLTTSYEIQLTQTSVYDGIHGGMSAIPNVASGTAGGLLTVGTGSLSLNAVNGVGDANIVNVSGTGVSYTSGGRINVNTTYIAGQAASLDSNNYLKVDVEDAGGTAIAVTAGLLSANITQALGHAVTTTTNGILDINVKNYNNVTATTDANNYPKVDVVDIAGTAVSVTTAQLGVNVVNWNNTVVATPATAGIPDINVKNIVNTAAAIDSNNYLKVDVVDAGGTAVTVTAGLLASNVTQFAGTGITSTAGIPSVNTTQFLGHAVVLDSNNYPDVNIVDIAGTASQGAAGYVGLDWSKITNATATENLSGTTVNTVTSAVTSNLTQINGTNVTATSGVMAVNTTQFAGTAITSTAGIPSVNLTQILGTAATATSGIMSVNTTQLLGNAVVVDSNHYLSTNIVDVAGTAVSATAGLLNANITQALGTAITATSGIMAVNSTQIASQTAQLDSNNFLKTDIADIGGTAVTQTAGIPSVNLTQILGTSATATSGVMSVNTTQFNGYAVALDSSHYLKTDVEDWGGGTAGSMVSSAQFTTFALANAPSGGGGTVNANLVSWNGNAISTMVNGSQQFSANALALAPVGGTSGSGQWAITYTVVDSVSNLPILGVVVTAVLSGASVAFGTTNSSGNVTLMLNTGSYTFLAGISGYFNYAATGIGITANGNQSIIMTKLPSPTPATGNQCLLYFYSVDGAGVPRNNVRYSFEITAGPASPLGYSYGSIKYAFSNSSGLVQYLGLQGGVYTIAVQGGNSVAGVSIPTGNNSYLIPQPPM